MQDGFIIPDVRYIPSIADFKRVSEREITEILTFLGADPPLKTVAKLTKRIIEILEVMLAISVPDDHWSLLVQTIAHQFGQLGLWEDLYFIIFKLLTTKENSEVAEARLRAALAQIFLYKGQFRLTKQQLDALMKLTNFGDDAAADQVTMTSISFALLMGDIENGMQRFERMQWIASASQDYILLGMTYQVLAQYHAQQLHYEDIFTYGQMLYCVGNRLQRKTFMINGLHLMGMSFQTRQQAHRAFSFLEAAKLLCEADHLYSNYLSQTRASCLYQLGKYDKALEQYDELLESPAIQGAFRANILYAEGLCLLKLHRFEEAEASMEDALDLFNDENYVTMARYVRHGLADLYWRTGRAQQAVSIMEQIVQEASHDQSQVPEIARKEFESDLVKYRRDSPEAK